MCDTFKNVFIILACICLPQSVCLFIFFLGFGSSLTINGDVEMDAIVMEGTRMKAGAVAAVTKVTNPVTLARRIMEQVAIFYYIAFTNCIYLAYSLILF